MSRPLRPVWWREVALVAGTYAIYSLTRNTLPDHVARARRHAEDVLRLEQQLHLDLERSFNHALATHVSGPLAVAADYLYATAHIWVALAVLCWLYVARPEAYRGARTVLLVTTWLSLLGFWLYPLAPPRLLPDLGFVDTVVREHVWGSWGSSTVERMSNQYAAMPSAHVAWSVWVAAVLVLYARRRLVRVVALA